MKDVFTGKPTIYLYDCVAGGVGLSDKLYEMDRELLLHAREMLLDCKCVDGCPSCVGAAAGPDAKSTLIQVLNRLLEQESV